MWERGLKLVRRRGCARREDVAPYVGAWIETPVSYELERPRRSLPMWERGLKMSNFMGLRDRYEVNQGTCPYDSLEDCIHATHYDAVVYHIEGCPFGVFTYDLGRS